MMLTRVRWDPPTVHKNSAMGWLGPVSWLCHHIWMFWTSMTFTINYWWYLLEGENILSHSALLIFPNMIVSFPYLFCVVRIFHDKVCEEWLFSPLNGLTKEKEKISNILHQDSLSLHLLLCCSIFMIFSLFINCFLNMRSWICHLLAPFLVFSHPSFSSHLYVSMCVSRCAR